MLMALPWFALGCGEHRADPTLYVQALTADLPFEQAMGCCRSIREEQVSQDCQLAVMERHGRLEEADCGAMPGGLWRDECHFLLAERQWDAGRRQQAIATCGTTRFGRACVYHLVWKLGEDVEEAPGAEAEEALRLFAGNTLAPDAPRVFWRDRFRRRLGEGLPLDPTECVGLRDISFCRSALDHQLVALLDAQHRARGAELCLALRDDPVPVPLTPGRGAWLVHPLTRTIVGRWQNTHCDHDSAH